MRLLRLLVRMRLPLLMPTTASTSSTVSATAASAGPSARADSGDTVGGEVLCGLRRLHSCQVLRGRVYNQLISPNSNATEAVGVVEKVESNGRWKPAEEGVAKPGRLLFSFRA